MKPPLLRLALLSLVAILPGGAGPAVAQGAVGAIRGTVLDRDFEAPLPGVRVSIPGRLLTTTTTDDGNFVFEAVPAGSYSLSFAREGYQRETRTSVVVTPGRLTDVGVVTMALEIYELEELVVTAPELLGGSEIAALDIRAAAVTMQDTISAELIGRSGASDVADAVKQVVGASIVDGKYATVRGLSDRYTGTTLNGIRVPSADPRRRAVQIDLFPTGTIESVTVSKTFTPDLQGEFTGGGVDIRTKSVPDGFTLSVSASVEHHAEATFNDRFLTYRGGGVDLLGVDSSRDLPPLAAGPIPPQPLALDPAGVPSHRPLFEQALARAEFYDAMVRSFSPVMGTSTDEPGLGQSLKLVAGNRFDLAGEGVLGVIGALTWSHKFDFYDDGFNNRFGFDSTGFVPRAIREDSEGTDEVLVGALGTLVYRPVPDHELALRLVANQSATDDARFQLDTNASPRVQNQSLEYTERNVTSLQLAGDHRYPGDEADDPDGLRVGWTVAYNTTSQDQPDVRFFQNRASFDENTGMGVGGFPPNTTDAGRTRRIFREIDESNTQGKLDLELPFVQWTGTEGQVKLGAFVERTDRDFMQRSFTYTFPFQAGNFFFNPAVIANNGIGDGYSTDDPQLKWTDIFNDPERIGLAPNRCEPTMSPQPFGATCASPNQLLWVLIPPGVDVDYVGDSSIDAGYAMIELPLVERLELIAGARVERTDISIEPISRRMDGEVEIIVFEPTAPGQEPVHQVRRVPEEQATADILQTEVLPSVGLVWDVVENMKLRGSWSRTLARPTFRELAAVATEEFIADDELTGTPDLELTRITNWDARWEWFRRPGEVLAASVFYKELENPIQYISFTVFGSRTFVQPVNFERGELSGLELEARTELDWLAAWLGNVTLGANYTVLDSEVDVPPDERESLDAFGLGQETQQLQGQPANLINLNLSYDNDESGTSAAVFFNRVGETLLTGAAVGEEGAANVFERPIPTLDLVAQQQILRGREQEYAVSFKATNLLEPDRLRVYRTPGGLQEIRSSRETSIKLSLSASVKW